MNWIIRPRVYSLYQFAPYEVLICLVQNEIDELLLSIFEVLQKLIEGDVFVV